MRTRGTQTGTHENTGTQTGTHENTGNQTGTHENTGDTDRRNMRTRGTQTGGTVKLEKEKREHAKQHGMIRTEFSGGEIAEEMEKERRLFQLQTCEYLLKVNEIKVKKGVDFLQNLIKYFHAQCNFFQDGLKAVESLKPSVEKLTADLSTIKQAQDGERKQLTQLRDVLKTSLQSEQKEGNKAHGTERIGTLYKKSEG
ncbi:hypothetical protein F7725_028382 [Dissostichus mawsoni]|uniref:BAR domain-containing protein n=1 Tax=Dissostichus mawsoni TaxID=36200 RepID=A0A7J5XFM3_DISMA|nr:hypothetical protein F7725_028382 [Dissostichus mawsoni]